MIDEETSLDQSKRTRTNAKMHLEEYACVIRRTDSLPKGDLNPVILGLFGEVGSLMAVSKKRYREREAFPWHHDALIEEFGDVLWYFVALCGRLGVGVNTVFQGFLKPGQKVSRPVSDDHALLSLGRSTAALLDPKGASTQQALKSFACHYAQALRVCGLNFPVVIASNAAKVTGRFIEPDLNSLPTFDDEFPEDERLPSHFEIRITQRKSGMSYMQWNGVFIGDPLTDNISEPDGYRYHDVFHLAHTAILHWSPTFRGLIKHKRKTVPKIDRTQDGGRAIVIEEGLTAWMFSHAKQLDFFQGQDSVSFDILKTVQQFVRGYEVEQCPLSLWERAILQGYEVFREVLHNQGGTIVGDRKSRSISYVGAQ